MATYSPRVTAQQDYGIEESVGIIYGKGYNEKGNLDAVRKLSEFTITPVGTATATVGQSDYPRIASSGTSYVTGLSNQPVASSNARPIVVEAAIAADGVTIDFSASPIATRNDTSIGITFKASSLTPTFTVTIEGTTGTDTLTLTAIDLADYGFVVNQWKNLRLKLEQFTATAAFPYGDIRKITIIASAAVEFKVSELQVGNNIFCLVGSEFTLRFRCPKEVVEEFDRSVEAVMCQNTQVDSRSTAKSATLTFKYLGVNISHDAYMTGTTLKSDASQYSLRYLNGTGAKFNKNVAIDAAGLCTLGSAVDPAKIYSVFVDGVSLSRVDSVDQVDDTSFHATDAGVFTFAIGYATQTPEIIDETLENVTYFKENDILDSFAFALTTSRTIESGTRETKYHRAKFNSLGMSQESAYVDTEAELAVLRDVNGDYRTVILK